MTGKGLTFSRRVRMYREGYVSVCVYLNVRRDGKEFYDTVIYRKIKNGNGDKWERGANLKPSDLPVIIKLLDEANEYLEAELSTEPDCAASGFSRR